MVKATFEKAVLHSSKTGTGRTVLLNSQFESGVAILAIKIFDSVKLLWWISVHNIPIFEEAVIFMLP